LGEVGSLLVKRKPDFDPRNFGFLKMGKLIEQLDSFDIDCRSTSNPNIKHIYIRNR
jgi:Fe-S-cluster formation regulator IscX/YfhJ